MYNLVTGSYESLLFFPKISDPIKPSINLDPSFINMMEWRNVDADNHIQ